MVGAPLVVVTVNAVALVAEPDGEVTAIAPVVAPAGTEVTRRVAVAAVTVAAVPLTVTAFRLGVVLNPVPEITTLVPTGPLPGENAMIDTVVDGKRAMDRRLPTAS
jgi:hypothetical protein